MATSNPQITLSAVANDDYPTIARLESAAFANDEWSDVTFGRDRKSEEAIALRAVNLAVPPQPGEVLHNMKAVVAGPDGDEIVGFASWELRDRSVNDSQGKKDEDEMRMLPKGANLKLFEGSILKGDEIMERSTEGRDYAKLRNLVVAPKYQRRGIGARLLEDGLREADARGIQAVLAASPDGLGLYKKHGFVVFEALSFNLWEYEGGEGMGVAEHYIMHRPAATSEGGS